jgi:hypothetical protein
LLGRFWVGIASVVAAANRSIGDANLVDLAAPEASSTKLKVEIATSDPTPKMLIVRRIIDWNACLGSRLVRRLGKRRTSPLALPR